MCENIANTSVTEVSLKINLLPPESLIDFCYYGKFAELEKVIYDQIYDTLLKPSTLILLF